MGLIKKVQYCFASDCQLSLKDNFFRGANVRLEDFDARGFRVSGFVVEIDDDVGVVHSNSPTCRSGHGDNHRHHYHNHFCFVIINVVGNIVHNHPRNNSKKHARTFLAALAMVTIITIIIIIITFISVLSPLL